ncbi:mannitol operon transcriptional antiterminator [Geomicrobium halophilum]|uniref:Mannitol operon transcriptional antiterminator n=1 Tax=Geomicrobium halophilum TaxID=549000 RepID=A0A841PYB8_9BACL|nr:mannitol operon transcriptional antiterminator [Geomicrobium halophilum]
MYVSARERLILLTLLEAGQGVSLSELAKTAAVSPRTVQRDIKGLKQVVDYFGLKIKRGSHGVLQLEGSHSDFSQLEQFLHSFQAVDFTPEERQSLLLVKLLDSHEPMKLFTLANDLNITEATVSNDLTKATEWLEQFGLQLVRKRGYGIDIEGTETNVRRAMSSIIAENLNLGAFYRAIYAVKDNQMEREVTHRMLNFVDVSTIRLVVDTVERVKTSLPGQMSDQAYIRLIVHVTLAIERIRQGEEITMDQDQLEALETGESHETALELGEKLGQAFGISVPRAEIGYIVMHLRGAQSASVDIESFYIEESNIELIERIKALIAGVEDEWGVSLSTPSLLQGLLTHLKPTLYRIRQKMKITNPLLVRIKSEYPSLFAVVRRQVKKTFAPLEVPDEEIGYLVLHFGAVLERRKRFTPLSALVVCASGIGSAKMLASRLEQEFPEITSITNASLFDLKKYDPDDFDLFISTVHLDQSKSSLRVSPVLTTEEVNRIRAYVDERKVQPSGNRKDPANVQKTDLATFQKTADVSEAIHHFLQSYQMDGSKSVEEGLWTSCRTLEEHAQIYDSSSVYQALLARESRGGVAIPETSLALFHTRTKDVRAPVFHIVELDNSKPIASMGSEMQHVKRIMIMLAPEDFQEHELAFMSYMSMLFVGPKEQVARFETGTKEEIYYFLEQKCRDYLLALIQEGVEYE